MVPMLNFLLHHFRTEYNPKRRYRRIKVKLSIDPMGIFFFSTCLIQVNSSTMQKNAHIYTECKVTNRYIKSFVPIL